MNRSFLQDSRGQMQQVLSAALGVIVVFAALSLGMSLVNNFEGVTNTGAAVNPVPLKDIAWLTIAGIAILALLVALLKLLQ